MYLLLTLNMDSNYNKVVGGSIKKYRSIANLSQRDLGIKAGELLSRKKPISQKQISKYEKGKVAPKTDVLRAIASALNIDINKLTRED
jgi:transcriptional regulator with XRE-family HTH domain